MLDVAGEGDGPALHHDLDIGRIELGIGGQDLVDLARQAVVRLPPGAWALRRLRPGRVLGPLPRLLPVAPGPLLGGTDVFPPARALGAPPVALLPCHPCAPSSLGSSRREPLGR